MPLKALSETGKECLKKTGGNEKRSTRGGGGVSGNQPGTRSERWWGDSGEKRWETKKKSPGKKESSKVAKTKSTLSLEKKNGTIVGCSHRDRGKEHDGDRPVTLST